MTGGLDRLSDEDFHKSFIAECSVPVRVLGFNRKKVRDLFNVADPFRENFSEDNLKKIRDRIEKKETEEKKLSKLRMSDEKTWMCAILGPSFRTLEEERVIQKIALKSSRKVQELDKPCWFDDLVNKPTMDWHGRVV